MRHGILIIGNFLSAEKTTRSVCEELAQRLAENGWIVLTSSRRIPRASRLLDMISSVWLYRNRYQVAQVDVFSGPSFLWAELVCWVLKSAGKPFVLTLHGGNLPQFARKNDRRVRRLLQPAGAVTVPSRYLLEQMQSYCDRLQLIPNGIDLESYPFRPRERPLPRLVWVRAFHEIYNPTLAPRVLALLGERFHDVRLEMYGPDKGDGSRQATERLADELHVQNRIQFCGAVPKERIPSILDQSDIFLNTTNFDNSPVTVMEALACGLCVVSTDAGGLPYLVEHDQQALLVPRENASAMAAAVTRILTERDLAVRLGINGRELAAKSDWSRVLPEWQAVLSSLLLSVNR